MGLMGESGAHFAEHEPLFSEYSRSKRDGVEKRILEGAQVQFLQLLFCVESPAPLNLSVPEPWGPVRERFPALIEMVKSNPATTPQVPDVDLRLRSEGRNRLPFHMANSRNVSKVALIPQPQVPQGKVADSGGCYGSGW